LTRSTPLTLDETIRDAVLSCAQKLTRVSLISRTEPTKSGKKQKKKLNSKNRHAQKYRKTVREICGVNLEEEKEGYGGKDLQKRNVLSLE